MRLLLCLSLFALSSELLALIKPIPREVRRNYLNEGTLEGGTLVQANIANLRFGEHKKGGYERWVVDFSDPRTKAIGQVAPKFSVRYARPQFGLNSEGAETQLQPGRLLLSFRNIQENQVPLDQVSKLVERSKLVSNVVFYPPIEDGDRVIELVLKKPVYFEAHQPARRAGRLVLDLKSVPSE